MSNSFLLSNLKNDKIPPEKEEGNVEYKMKIIQPSPLRLEQLISQMKWRLREGDGLAIYQIGVSDSGYLTGISESEASTTLMNLRKMASANQAAIEIITELDLTRNTHKKKVYEVKCKRLVCDVPVNEIRVILVGAADAGKSSLLGVLCYDEIDNGVGKSRLNLLRHRHELRTGRTSSLALEVIGYTEKGEVINYATPGVHSSEHVVEQADKLICFSDTCGHSKYLKTTVTGLSGHFPDYACLVLAGNEGGVTEMAKEHLSLLLMMNIPFLVIVTKIDISTRQQLSQTMRHILGLMSTLGKGLIPYILQDIEGLSEISQKNVVPIVMISNVSGENIDLLKRLFFFIQPQMRNTSPEEPLEFQILCDFSLPAVEGRVVGGILLSGEVDVRQKRGYLLGPVESGEFLPVHVNTIQQQKREVSKVKARQVCSFQIIGRDEKLAKVRLRKGMLVLSQPLDQLPPKGIREFEVELCVEQPSSICLFVGYQGMVHTGAIRQEAKIIWMEKLSMKKGERGRVKFMFLYDPEYVKVGNMLLLRGQKLRCSGKICKV